ncbi:hypothetical protein [Peribacillus frigoritolerans]|uniref:hypothetical protein n=1 Tax=Peribacillus frigoritolerans TaxID=450367 RepID=UPI00105AA37B|nr:hypothetical protein [Peribacillus frigoritolerans]TDL82417.1 hypothetical protein E2R53_02245 [Peribacillus frigoritolerans]
MERLVFFYRKCLVVVISAMMYTGYAYTEGFTNFELNPSALFSSIIFFAICIIGYTAYGLPISILTELITKKIVSYKFVRAFTSGILHLSGGFLFYFISEDLMYYSVQCTIVFFLTDEVLRMLEKRYSHICLKGWV